MIHKLGSAAVATCYGGCQTQANYWCSFLSGLNLIMDIFLCMYMYMDFRIET
jgi:hypothetical protein